MWIAPAKEDGEMSELYNGGVASGIGVREPRRIPIDSEQNEKLRKSTLDTLK